MNNTIVKVFILSCIMLANSLNSFAQCTGFVIEIDENDSILVYPDPEPWPPALPTEPNTEKKNIYFIHGLGGNSGSLGAMATYVDTDWFAFGHTPEYPNNQWSLDDAARQVSSKMQSLASTKTDYDFAFGHSQGGMVGKTIVKNRGEQFFHGLITMGTPHAGAQIVNNLTVEPDAGPEEDYGIRFFRRACQDLSAGYIEDIATFQVFSFNFRVNRLSSVLEEITCDQLTSIALTFAFDAFLKESAQDFKVGSSFLPTIRNTGTGNRIVLYGIESEPLMWRSIHWFQPNKDPNAYGPPSDKFGWASSDEEQQTIDAANEQMMNYMAEVEEHEWLTSVLKGLYPFLPCNGLDWVIHLGDCLDFNDDYKASKRAAKAWQKGVDWFQNANFYYKEMIGAAPNATERTECWCREKMNDNGIVEYGNWFFNRVIEPGEDCSLGGLEGEVRECEARKSYFQGPSKASDGIVLEDSAKDFPGATSVLLDGNSHLQMRSSPEAREVITQILDGAPEFNPFFFTLRE